jgi:hypothetical protein
MEFFQVYAREVVCNFPRTHIEKLGGCVPLCQYAVAYFAGTNFCTRSPPNTSPV